MSFKVQKNYKKIFIRIYKSKLIKPYNFVYKHQHTPLQREEVGKEVEQMQLTLHYLYQL